MKKSLIQILPTACGLLVGSVFFYCLTLFLQFMTYRKEARTIAGQDYVSEVTRWPGHTYVNNIPVVRPQDLQLWKNKMILVIQIFIMEY